MEQISDIQFKIKGLGLSLHLVFLFYYSTSKILRLNKIRKILYFIL